MINTVTSNMKFCGDGMPPQEKLRKCGKPARVEWLGVWWCKQCHGIWLFNHKQWQRTPHEQRIAIRQTTQETLGLPDDDFFLSKVLTLGN
jgi:hypothetical protein